MTNYVEADRYTPGCSQCDNCGKVWRNGNLNDIRDYHMRVDVGTLSEPSGECPDPECGALCYFTTIEVTCAEDEELVQQVGAK